MTYLQVEAGEVLSWAVDLVIPAVSMKESQKGSILSFQEIKRREQPKLKKWLQKLSAHVLKKKMKTIIVILKPFGANGGETELKTKIKS